MKNLATIFTLLGFTFFSLLSPACSNDELPVSNAESIKLKPEMEQKVKQDNQFAFDLLKTVYNNESNPNIFISPFSVSMCLSMVLNGANGSTRSEIENTLQISGFSLDKINEYYRILHEELLKIDPTTQLGIANSIWYDKNFPVKSDFQETNKNDFNAEIEKVDFKNKATIKQINDWCAKNTKNKIPEIIDDIPEDAVMYLINAVYFKGMWREKFNKSATTEKKFYANDGTEKVQMMIQNNDFDYYSDENAGYLELIYGNQAFSMITILPHEEKTINDIINNLNENSWNDAIQGLHVSKVDLQLPRFKIECKYLLHETILPVMGMKIPFTEFADFSNISDIPTCISQVIHKTYLDVNEEGTEAAAATSVGMMMTSAPMPTQAINYNVNKPFILVIRERSTGIVMFIGKVGNPQ